jgi:hypothetical protein
VGVSAVRSLGKVDQIHVAWSLADLNVTFHSALDTAPMTVALDRSDAQ